MSQDTNPKRGLREIACLVLTALAFLFGLIPLAGNLFRILLGIPALILGVLSLRDTQKQGNPRDTLLFVATIIAGLILVWAIVSIVASIMLLGTLTSSAGEWFNAFTQWFSAL